MRKKESFQIHRALTIIILILAAQNAFARPSSKKHIKNHSTRDSVKSHFRMKEDSNYSSKSAQANRHILINGGGSVWDGAEYSQYEHFLAWYRWSVEQPNSKTVPVFSDGFRNEKNSLKLYKVTRENFFEIGMPNLVLLEDGKKAYRRASFPNNFPATYTSLRERFKEANYQTHDLLIVIGDHGVSPVNKRDNYCQLALQDRLDSDYKTSIKSFGFTDLDARDSLIVGWYGISQKKDRDAALRRDKVNGRANQLISSKDLLRMRDELSISGDFKFIANQCYSGAVAWMAFDPSRQKLRGDTCGITASTFYYHSTGCSPYPNLKAGHGYWVSKGITEQVDIDGDGETSLLDLHLYAMMNDEYDRGPQITSGVLLQQKGLLPWPIESKKDFIVNQDSFPSIFKRGQADQEHACVPLSQIFEETQGGVQSKLKEVRLTEENERKMWQLKRVLLWDSEDHPQNHFPFYNEAIERYKSYLKAEQIFLEMATTEEREAYLSAKRCETSAIR